MDNMNLERITPTKENLEEFFKIFPDHKQRYYFAKDMLKSDFVVADCACGVGYGTYILSNNCKNIIGFDIAQDALNHAKKHFKVNNIQFLHADSLTNNLFDFIVSFETIEHMDEEAGDVFLQNFKKSLNKDGRLLISTPINKTDFKHNVTEYHIREYDDVEFLEKLKKNGFEIIEMYGQGSDFHEALYGEGSSKISIFSLMKLGLHKLLPQSVRKKLKSILLGDEQSNLKIKKENWQNTAVQIALCRVKD